MTDYYKMTTQAMKLNSKLSSNQNLPKFAVSYYITKFRFKLCIPDEESDIHEICKK